MRRGLTRLAAVVAAALIPLAWTTPAVAQPATARYIVTLDPALGSVATAAAGLVATLGAGRVITVYQYALKGFAVDVPVALAPTLAALPGVAAVERDGIVRLADTQTGAPWGLDRIDQRSRPLDGTYVYASAGAGVRAYVIDTGVRGTHQDFSGRVQPGVNTADGTPSTDDCNGHGTHVAGTIGGETYGVAKDVTLIAVRVFGCGDTTETSMIIAGVDWVTGNHQAGQPAVANMSLGGAASAALDTAVRNMVGDGISTGVAGGNDNANSCNYSPARVGEALGVGATDSNDARASFSNWGACIDLFAPGVGIVSAGIASDSATATYNGTSQATPHVVGAAALYLGQNPTASPSAVQSYLQSRATGGVITGIKTTCNSLDTLLGSCQAGTPNLLLYTGPASAPPPPPPPPGPPPACSALSHLLGKC